MKLLAYFGGAAVVDSLLADFQTGKPLASMEDIGAWFDRGWRLTIRRRSLQAALLFEVDKKSVMKLFKVHTRLMELRSADKVQEGPHPNEAAHTKAFLDGFPWLGCK